MLTKDHAICIRATDYSETSQIVTLFTKESGKISAIAKGSKRPKSSFDGAIELFAYGRIVFAHSDDTKLATLTEFEQEPQFSAIAGNLFSLNCASFAAELVNSLTTEFDPHPQLFDNFLQFLQDVNEIRFTFTMSIAEGLHASRDTLSLLILFQLSLLREIGLQPVLNYCVNCNTKYACPERSRGERRATSDELYFSSSANGLICKDCEAAFTDKIKLSLPAAECLIDLKKIADAGAHTLKEIEKVLVYHFTELLGKPPRMAKYILK